MTKCRQHLRGTLESHLPTKSISMLSMDGPYTDWSVHKNWRTFEVARKFPSWLKWALVDFMSSMGLSSQSIIPWLSSQKRYIYYYKPIRSISFNVLPDQVAGRCTSSNRSSWNLVICCSCCWTIPGIAIISTATQ